MNKQKEVFMSVFKSMDPLEMFDEKLNCEPLISKISIGEEWKLDSDEPSIDMKSLDNMINK